MAKYDPLFAHLCRASDGPVEMTFDAIAALVGTLPAGARRSAWWSSGPDGSTAQSRAWRNAGRRVERVDVAAALVTFSAAEWTRGA